QQVEGHRNKKLHFTTLENLEKERPLLGAAVIATQSQGRGDILASVLRLDVRHILCEKILFQSIAEYRKALEQVKNANAEVYVNHVYRYIPAYAHIKKTRASSAETLNMTITGGNNGMGCNLIHFLDLFEWLASETVTSLDVAIDTPLLPCKRGTHLIEFTGKAHARTQSGHTLAVILSGVDFAFPVLTMSYGMHKHVIDEATGWRASTEAQATALSTAMPRVSELTGRIVAEIANATTPLPTLQESFNANCHMLNAFNKALNQPVQDETICPIT
ncbi:MAG: hypothetical protein K2Q01_12160, partial [Rickettsiales bacterium]|nr:hypothetical protein [Rickettsiales bacterium]